MAHFSIDKVIDYVIAVIVITGFGYATVTGAITSLNLTGTNALIGGAVGTLLILVLLVGAAGLVSGRK